MPFLRDFNQFLLVVIDTIKSIGRARIWLVLAIYGLVMACGLAGLYFYFTPPTFAFAKAVSAIAGGEAARRFFHYPGHLLLLPSVYGWLKLILTVLLEGLFLGTAALYFKQKYSGGGHGQARSFGSLLPSWGHFVLASLLCNLLLFLAGYFLPQILLPILEGNPRRLMLFELIGIPAVNTLVLSLLFFAIPIIALRRQSAIKAVGRSLRIFIHRPFTCFFLAAISLFLPILAGLVANHPDTIIEKFYPEMVFWVLLGGLVAEMIGNFIWMGTAVRFLVDEDY